VEKFTEKSLVLCLILCHVCVVCVRVCRWQTQLLRGRRESSTDVI